MNTITRTVSIYMGGPAFLGQWYAESYSKYDCSKAVEKQGMY